MLSRLRSFRHLLFIWLPLVLAFLAVGLAVEVGYAQPASSSNYAAPRKLGSLIVGARYGAIPTARGWLVFGRDADGRMALTSYTSRSKLSHRTVVDSDGIDAGDAALSRSRAGILAAWIAGTNAHNLRLAFFGRRTVISNVKSSGQVGQISIATDGARGFVVVYSAQRTLAQNSNIFALQVRPTGTVNGGPHLLATSPEYDFNPVAATDGSGDLDVLYFESCCRPAAFLFEFRRFTPDLRPLGKPSQLGRMAVGNYSPQPGQWQAAMVPMSDGRVMAAFVDGTGISLAQWSATGRFLWRRLLTATALDPDSRDLALVFKSTGVVYYPVPGPIGDYIQATTFDSSGRQLSTQRVSYDQDGSAADPQAGLVGGLPRVSWINTVTPFAPDPLEASSYQRRVSLSVVNRLGLGVGNPALDAVFLIAGSLMAALGLTIANALVVVPLILLWFPISRVVREPLNWRVYTALVALVLLVTMGVPTFASHWVVLMAPLTSPLGLLGVAGGLFVGVWIAAVGLREQEMTIRAVAVTVASFYFLAAMWALAGIQSHLTTI
ncbi:MAG TPA: hypothetical protein VFB34_05385 [Chloroflexota bacterium]|nr:hypothetical protein [Chloroflexota bacterium]